MSLFLSLLNNTRACLLPGRLLNPSQSIHFRLFLPELHLLLLTFCFRLQMTLFISTLNDNFALPSCRLRVWAQWPERQPCLWAHLCGCPGPWPPVLRGRHVCLGAGFLLLPLFWVLLLPEFEALCL